MSCILMQYEWEVTGCKAGIRLLFCVSMARYRAGVPLCTPSSHSAANGYPINYISVAYEWKAWPVCTEAGFTQLTVGKKNLSHKDS